MLNTERFLYRALKSIAERNSYAFTTHSYGWIIEIRDHERVFRTNGYTFDINPPSGVLAARDKYAMHTLVSEILPPEHCIPSVFIPCLWKEGFIGITKQSILDTFLGDYSFPMIIKDLTWAQGTNVFRVDNQKELTYQLAYFESIRCDALLSPYIHSDTELRIILLDGIVHLAYHKRHGSDSWKFNLSEWASAIPIDPEQYTTIEPIIKEAKSIASHLGLRFASCDFFLLADGTHRFLEINAGVCVDHFVEMHPEYMSGLEHMYAEAMEKSFHS